MHVFQTCEHFQRNVFRIRKEWSPLINFALVLNLPAADEEWSLEAHLSCLVSLAWLLISQPEITMASLSLLHQQLQRYGNEQPSRGTLLHQKPATVAVQAAGPTTGMGSMLHLFKGPFLFQKQGLFAFQFHFISVFLACLQDPVSIQKGSKELKRPKQPRWKRCLLLCNPVCVGLLFFNWYFLQQRPYLLAALFLFQQIVRVQNDGLRYAVLQRGQRTALLTCALSLCSPIPPNGPLQLICPQTDD